MVLVLTFVVLVLGDMVLLSSLVYKHCRAVLIASYLVEGATRSQRQIAERSLEQFADELWFLVVECDTTIAVGALTGTVGDLRVVPLSHVGVGHSAEHRCLGCRANDVVMNDPRCGTLKSRKLEQMQQKEKDVSYLIRYSHVSAASARCLIPVLLWCRRLCECIQYRRRRCLAIVVLL